MRLLNRLRILPALLPVAACLLCVGQDKPRFNTASAGVNTAEVEAAIRLLCPQKNLRRGKDGQVDGCRVCPAGTGFAGMRNIELDIDAETPGHFTSAGTDNLILDANGCEPHADNFGGSYLFATEGGKTRLLRYSAGLITDQCHKFAFADGRNYLICRGGWAGQGEVDDAIYMTAFTATGKHVSNTLLSTRDTRGECGDESQSARSSEIKDIRFTPPNTAQITGLTITATLGNVSCGAVEESGKASAKRNTPAVKSYDVEFVFDGKGFKVAPGSRAALNRLTPSD